MVLRRAHEQHPSDRELLLDLATTNRMAACSSQRWGMRRSESIV